MLLLKSLLLLSVAYSANAESGMTCTLLPPQNLPEGCPSLRTLFPRAEAQVFELSGNGREGFIAVRNAASGVVLSYYEDAEVVEEAVQRSIQEQNSNWLGVLSTELVGSWVFTDALGAVIGLHETFDLVEAMVPPQELNVLMDCGMNIDLTMECTGKPFNEYNEGSPPINLQRGSTLPYKRQGGRAIPAQ